MIKQFKQLGWKGARLFIVATLFGAAVIVSVSTPASAASSDSYWGEIKSGNSLPGIPPKCLTTQGDAGKPVYQSYCWKDSWKLWHMKPAIKGSDYYYNVISDYNGYCLDVYAFSHADDAKVTTWPCDPNGSANQEWHPSWTSSNSFVLKPRHSEKDGPFYVYSNAVYPLHAQNYVSPRGKCLDVLAYSHNNGFPEPWNNDSVGDGRVIQWECLYGANQQWSYDGSWGSFIE